MVLLTFSRDHRVILLRQVAGMVLVNTTYTDPVRTAAGSKLWTAIERPILMPLQYLTIVASPLLRLSNWMSYFNGAGHLYTLISGFAGTQSWQAVDFSARYSVSSSPAVIARGMLGMMQYDASDILATISIPTLVLSGDKDVCCREDASETIAKALPDGRLIVFKPGNHMALMEHRKEFAEAVSDFAIGVTQRKPQNHGDDRQIDMSNPLIRHSSTTRLQPK